jgi:hypothetical protein
MTSYTPHHDELTAHTHYVHGYWTNESASQHYLTNTFHALDTASYAYPQIDKGNDPTIPPSYFSSYLPLPPLHSSPTLQPLVAHQPVPNTTSNLDSYNLIFSRSVPTRYPSIEASASLSLSAMTTIPTMSPITITATVKTGIAYQMVKFACPACGKICTSRPRAYTCFCNHIGAKPFACNGNCGTVDW